MSGERELRELEARLGRHRHVLVSRIRDDEDEQPLEAELIDRGARERNVAVVRRVEGASQHAYCHSSASPATSTSTPA